MNRKHPSEEQLLDAQFHLLDARQSAEIKAHLETCAPCRNKAGSLSNKMAGLETLAKPVEVPERLIAGVLREARKAKAPRETVFPSLAWFAGIAAAAALMLILFNPQPKMRNFDDRMAAAPQPQRTTPSGKSLAPAASRQIERTATKTALIANEEPLLRAAESPAHVQPPQVMVVAMLARQESVGQISGHLAMAVERRAAPQRMAAASQDQLALAPRKKESVAFTALEARECAAAPQPAWPQERAETLPSTFTDFTVTSRATTNVVVGAEQEPPAYACSIWNTNAFPLQMTFQVEISKPQWSLQCDEPGVLATRMGERNWQLSFGLGPSTNRCIAYSLVPEP